MLTSVFKKLGPSFLLYLAGLLAIYATDLYVISNFSVQEISNWAVLKAVVFISVPLALVGLDDTIVRNKQLESMCLLLLSLQIPIISIVLAVSVVTLGYVENGVVFAITIALIGFNSVVYAINRSNYRLVRSQLASNFWKICILLGVLLVALTSKGVNFEYLFLGAATISAVVNLVANNYLLKQYSKDSLIQSIQKLAEQYKKAYGFGIQFFIAMLVLNVSLQLEQLLIFHYGNSALSAEYFTYIAAFLMPLSIANGFINFLIGPFIRKHAVDLPVTISLWKFRYLLFSIVFVFLGVGAGYILFGEVLGSEYEIDFRIVFILALVAFLRLLFSVCSGVIATHANFSQLRMFITGNVAGLVTYGVLFIILHRLQIDLLLCVALSVLSNWVVRGLNAMGVFRGVLKDWKVE